MIAFILMIMASGLIVFIDQLTKYLAIEKCINPLIFTKFFYCELTFNRGISWGIFNDGSTVSFVGSTLLTVAILIGLISYVVIHIRRGEPIFGAIFIIAGAVSNLFDRFFYHGVVDFMVFHYGDWSWPAFNIADGVIVFGVVALLIQGVRKPCN